MSYLKYVIVEPHERKDFLRQYPRAREMGFHQRGRWMTCRGYYIEDEDNPYIDREEEITCQGYY